MKLLAIGHSFKSNYNLTYLCYCSSEHTVQSPPSFQKILSKQLQVLFIKTAYFDEASARSARTKNQKIVNNLQSRKMSRPKEKIF